MKRVYFLLAISLIAILFSNSLFAQTSTMMNTATTEREILSTTNFKPIKSISISADRVLSLAQYFGVQQSRKNCVIHSGDSIYPIYNLANDSYFFLTEEGNLSALCIHLPNITITDFDYDEEDKMVYFCGIYQITNNSNLNVIGSFHKDMLFVGSTTIDLHPINIPNSSVLKKIDFYRAFGSEDDKLSLIANDDANTSAFSGNNEIIFSPSYFITYDLQTNNYHVKEVENVRLTDVIHTSTKVAVAGILDKEHLVLFSHRQDNIDNYDGRIFETYPLYDFLEDMKYSIEALNNDTIVIGASVIADGYGRMEFATFDILNNINLLHIQFIANNVEIECRSKIIDMKYDKEFNVLHTLAFNGCTSKDVIFRIEPYNITTHTSFMVVPNMMSSGKNLLKSITIYKGINDHCYLAFGALDNQLSIVNTDTITTGNLYFFDRMAYSLFDKESPCESVTKIDIETARRTCTSLNLSYRQSYNFQSSSITYLPQTANPYNITIMCND
jgi:hypothetical protein